MLTPSWCEEIEKALSQLTAHQAEAKIAIVGVGQELNGDDFAGISVINKLRPRFADKKQLMLIEAGPAPENFTGPIRQFAPDLVIMIDAADMGVASGTIHCLRLEDIDGLSASTHTQPLSMFAAYLTSELNCNVLLIGIQPATTLLGAAPSIEVQYAVAVVTQELRRLL